MQQDLLHELALIAETLQKKCQELERTGDPEDARRLSRIAEDLRSLAQEPA
jgi:hypothetical protein